MRRRNGARGEWRGNAVRFVRRRARAPVRAGGYAGARRGVEWKGMGGSFETLLPRPGGLRYCFFNRPCDFGEAVLLGGFRGSHAGFVLRIAIRAAGQQQLHDRFPPPSRRMIKRGGAAFGVARF